MNKVLISITYNDETPFVEKKVSNLDAVENTKKANMIEEAINTVISNISELSEADLKKLANALKEAKTALKKKEEDIISKSFYTAYEMLNRKLEREEAYYNDFTELILKVSTIE